MKAEVQNWRLNSFILCLFVCTSCVCVLTLYFSVGISRDIAQIENKLEAAQLTLDRKVVDEQPDDVTEDEGDGDDVMAGHDSRSIVQFLSGNRGRERRGARGSRRERKRDRRNSETGNAKMVRFELESGEHSFGIAHAGEIGPWNYATTFLPRTDISLRTRFGTRETYKSRVELKEPSESLYYIYAHVTFGPTEPDFCQRHGFSINVNGEDVARAVSREFTGNQDCSAFVASQDVSTIVSLKRNDVITLRTLYPKMSILAAREYTFWGMVKLR